MGDGLAAHLRMLVLREVTHEGNSTGEVPELGILCHTAAPRSSLVGQRIVGDRRASLSSRHPGFVTRRGDGRSVLQDDNAYWSRPGNQDQTKYQPAPRGALSYSRCSREGFGGYSWV